MDKASRREVERHGDLEERANHHSENGLEKHKTQKSFCTVRCARVRLEIINL